MSTATPKPQGLPPAYDPSSVEQRRYRQWLDGGYFAPNPEAAGQPFVIIQPPPNVTGRASSGPRTAGRGGGRADSMAPHAR